MKRWKLTFYWKNGRSSYLINHFNSKLKAQLHAEDISRTLRNFSHYEVRRYY